MSLEPPKVGYKVTFNERELAPWLCAVDDMDRKTDSIERLETTETAIIRSGRLFSIKGTLVA